jgi:hypothetical protein
MSRGFEPPPEVVEPFPARHLSEIKPQATEQQWLIEDLWVAEGVGIWLLSKTCETAVHRTILAQGL